MGKGGQKKWSIENLTTKSVTALLRTGGMPEVCLGWGALSPSEELLMPLLLHLLFLVLGFFWDITRSTFLSTRVNVHFCYFILDLFLFGAGWLLEGKGVPVV